MPLETTPDFAGPQLVSPPVAGRIISGFWRRVLALAIDCLLLSLPVYFFGLFFFFYFAYLGGWGRLLGFTVALLYFGLWNSSLGKGQTPGKGLMKIEVVDRSGNFIPLGRSLFRFTILGGPWFLNSLHLPIGALVGPAGYVIVFILGLIVFGLGGGILYLYLFNRRTRQSLHDLVAGTLVVRTSPKGTVPPVSIWKTHLKVLGVWFLIVVGISIFVPYLGQKMGAGKVLGLYESLESSGKFRAATVNVTTTRKLAGKPEPETIACVVKVELKKFPAGWGELAAVAREIAATVLDKYPEVMKDDLLSIEMIYGYDFGIAWSWQKWWVRYRPSRWQEFVSNPELMLQVMMQEMRQRGEQKK